MTATCGAYAPEPDFLHRTGERLCGEPAVGTLVAGCVHEHVARWPVCAGCAADIQRADGLTCTPCDERGCRDCPDTGWIEWDDGSPRTPLPVLAGAS